MNYVVYALEALVGAALLTSALGTALLSPRQALFLPQFPKSRLVRITIAILTGLPGVGMLVAAAVPFFAFFVALLSVAVTAALSAFVRLAGGRPAWLASGVVVAASTGVAILQPLGLKVLSLPKADSLPYAPVPAQVVKTYGKGIGFESVRAGPDGTLYLAANTGLDFSGGEYFRTARGQIIARTLERHERILFSTPVGSTAGVIAVAADGTLFMTSNGREPGIWRILRDGNAKKIVTLPRGAWPNGLDFGPDGRLYSPDSSLAQIWRIDPASGKSDVVLRDPRLAARPFVALAPGANGLHFAGRDMIVTVSDSTEVLAYPLAEDGRFGTPKLLARGIPGDDFAIGKDGSLFVATHPYNTLVRITPDGKRSVIADARHGIVGATDATFGRGPNDRDTLYVATDGGAFTEGSSARGQLVALQPYR